MSRRAITNALKARLSTVALPKAWPNQDFDPSAPGNLPYLAVSIIRADTIDNTVAGEMQIGLGRLIVAVVVRANSADGAADDHADAVAALFPKGTVLPADEGTVEITGPPHVREGLTDGTHWRVPVIIPFRTY